MGPLGRKMLAWPVSALPVWFALAALVGGLVGAGPARAAERPAVFTVNYPLAYFAARIAGDRVRVAFPAPAGVDPAFWVPDAPVIVGYQNAALILANGAGYARWREFVSLPRRRIVDTSAAFRSKLLPLEGVAHTHGPTGRHSHGAVAATTWLDFDQAARQAAAVGAAFARRWPADRKAFEANLARLSTDLAALDRRMAALSARKPGLPLIASHPVYQYLARRYRLNLKSLHWEPDTPPTPEAWAKFERLLEGHKAGWLLWEATPGTETAARLKARGVRSVVFEPAGNRPEMGDFLSVMQRNIGALEAAFR